MFRVHSDGQQQLSRGAEVHVADAFAVRTAEDGQRLLAHGVPHVDRGGRSCAETERVFIAVTATGSVSTTTEG